MSRAEELSGLTRSAGSIAASLLSVVGLPGVPRDAVERRLRWFSLARKRLLLSGACFQIISDKAARRAAKAYMLRMILTLRDNGVLGQLAIWTKALGFDIERAVVSDVFDYSCVSKVAAHRVAPQVSFNAV